MTKKSQARQERDAVEKQQQSFMKTNKLWTELNTMSQEIAQQYASVVAEFYKTYVEDDLYKFIAPEDQDRFKLLVASIRQGMEQYSKDYQKIRATHANREGAANMDDMRVALDIYQSYTNLTTLQFGAQNNELQELSQIAGKALERYHAAKAEHEAEQALRDPNAVTDVQVKE